LRYFTAGSKQEAAGSSTLIFGDGLDCQLLAVSCLLCDCTMSLVIIFDTASVETHPACSVGLLTFQFRELRFRKWVKIKASKEAERRRYKWHSQNPAVLERVASVKKEDW
jgi:hypothetical protein